MRGLRVTVAAILGVCSAVAFVQTKKPAVPKKPDIGALRSDLKEIQQKKQAVKGQLKAVRGKIRVVKGTLEEVTTQIETLEVKLEETGRRLSASRAEQARLADELKVVSHDLQVKLAEAQHRIKAMRMRGEGSFASVLVGVRSVGELASRKFLYERIAARDHKLFTEVKTLRAAVATRKARQDQLVKQVAGLLVDQKNQQHELGERKEDQRALLSQLREKEGDLKKIIAQLDAEENQIEATIAAFMRDTSRTSGLTRPTGALLMPVAGGRIGSGFGMRMHPILRYVRMHKGVDIGARTGTPIRAAADGVVITATSMRGYGNVIVLGHGGNLSTLYAHCSRLLKSTGERVKRGETIALVGSTGLSTSPHLHFEVHVNGKAVNPRGFL